MVRAIDPKKVKTIADISSAFKRKIPNVALNLETATYEVKDAQGKVAKTITVEKGYDAAYVINRSNKEDDVESSGLWLQAQRKKVIGAAEEYETSFADLQDDLMRQIEAWKGANPGAARSAQALEVGRLQRNMATHERLLRQAQYNYREVLPTPLLRRAFVPLSFDDRTVPHPVFTLKQHINLAKDRVVPIL